jgi:hypothetical protein
MTPDEVARWNELPADEQPARLAVAIRRGVDSGPADTTMDKIWAKIGAHQASNEFPGTGWPSILTGILSVSNHTLHFAESSPRDHSFRGRSDLWRC